MPGCDPYREYLFNYLRDQPIFHTLRFWNAALFYALQKDKVPKASEIEGGSRKSSSSVQLKEMDEGKDALTNKEPSRSISESSLSSSSSAEKTASEGRSKYKAGARRARSKSTMGLDGDDNKAEVVDEKKSQDNMAFSHLG